MVLVLEHSSVSPSQHRLSFAEAGRSVHTGLSAPRNVYQAPKRTVILVLDRSVKFLPLAAHRTSACSQRAHGAKRSLPISSCEEAGSRTSDVGSHTCRLCACAATSAPSTRIAFGGHETGSSLRSGRAPHSEASSSSCKKQEVQLLTSHGRHAVRKEISDTLSYDSAHGTGNVREKTAHVLAA